MDANVSTISHQKSLSERGLHLSQLAFKSMRQKLAPGPPPLSDNDNDHDDYDEDNDEVGAAMSHSSPLVSNSSVCSSRSSSSASTSPFTSSCSSMPVVAPGTATGAGSSAISTILNSLVSRQNDSSTPPVRPRAPPPATPVAKPLSSRRILPKATKRSRSVAARSKSLPSHFDIDSLLEFLTASMSINKRVRSPRMRLSREEPSSSSLMLNSTRIDIRRAQSVRDLNGASMEARRRRSQCVYRVSDLVVNERLGEGFFAVVKKCTHRRTGHVMVLKELKSTAASFESEQAHQSFLKEAQVLRNLNHPNIVRFMGVLFTKDNKLNLILEYVSGGTLKDIVHNLNTLLPWKLRVGYAKDIAAGMEYLHSLNIIHRDLKSDNCLVRENGTVVVADFGLSRIVEDETLMSNLSMIESARVKDSSSAASNTTSVSSVSISSTTTQASTSACEGSSIIAAAKSKLKRPVDRKQRYAVVGNSFSMAPEMLKHEVYDERVDIFSFGIICCEIIGRVQADPDYLPRTTDFGLNVELFRKKYCEADCPKHFIRVAIACCELEPAKRPPFAKTHPWLETILLHLETNNPLPKNLLKNILDQNIKRP